MRKTLHAATFVALLCTAGAAAAATFLSGDGPGVPAGTTIEDDLYVAGGTVRIAGTIRGDLIAAGGTVLVEGEVTGDVLAAGGEVRITGTVGGTIRAAAGQFTLAAPVGEDVVVAAGDLSIGERARVGRDAVLSGGNVLLAGAVARNVWIGASDAALRADVGGDARAQVMNLEVGPVSVGGDLVYPENATVELDPGLQVAGRVVQSEALRIERGPLHRVWSALRWLVGLWALGALFTLAAPAWSYRATEMQLRRPGTAVLGGVAILIGVPFLSVPLFLVGLLVGGWWIALFLLALYGIALFLGVSLAGMAVGTWVRGRVNRPSWPWPVVLLVGVAILAVFFAIPILGAVVALVALLFGLGGLGLTMRQRAQAPTSPVV